MKRPLIGIGHSMGGNNLVNLSIMHPRLFTSLILIDPVIARTPSAQGNFAPARLSAKRRDRWPSREAAAASFKRSKFYQTWDPRVLDLWIKYGLRNLPTLVYPTATPASATPPVITADPSTATVSPDPGTEQEVTLTTTKHQEVLTFLRMTPKDDPRDEKLPLEISHPDLDPDFAQDPPFYGSALVSTFHKLPNLRPSVLYVFGDESHLSAPLLKADKLAVTGTGVGGSGGVKKGRVKEVTFKGVGHLIPMEVVGQTADACGRWIASETERWRALETVERRGWAAVPQEQKSKMTELYVDVISNIGLDEPPKAAKL